MNSIVVTKCCSRLLAPEHTMQLFLQHGARRLQNRVLLLQPSAQRIASYDTPKKSCQTQPCEKICTMCKDFFVVDYYKSRLFIGISQQKFVKGVIFIFGNLYLIIFTSFLGCHCALTSYQSDLSKERFTSTMCPIGNAIT